MPPQPEPPEPSPPPPVLPEPPKPPKPPPPGAPPAAPARVAAPAVVTVHLWTVTTGRVPTALLHLALDRRRLRRTPGLGFAKLLGTGSGRSFSPGDADPRRWGLLATWVDAEAATRFERSPLVTGWDAISRERWRASLLPLRARGRWAGEAPFGDPGTARTATGPRPVPGGPVAAITRARITPRKLVTFWRAVLPVSADLHTAPGLRFAIGIGEAPIGLQGTFSGWRSAGDLAAFAHGHAPHRAAIRRTAEEGWYAEELFARFAVLDSAGTIDGRDPLHRPT